MRTLSALTGSGTCGCGMYIFGPGSWLRPLSRTSPTTPMISRSGSSRELAHHAAADDQPLADRVLVLEGFADQRFVDDHDRRRRLGVAVGEDAAFLDRDLEHVEEAVGLRRPAAAAMEALVGRQRPADDDERQAVAAFERHAAGRGRLLDAGCSTELRDRVADASRCPATSGSADRSATCASSARPTCRSRGRPSAARSSSGSAGPSRSAGPARGPLR